MKLRNLKGTKDFLPEEQQLRNKIRSTLEKTFQRFSFMPLETPTICYYDLLSSKYAGGAEILKEVYKLNDQGNRQLGLRYDLTVPFAKVIGMNPNLNTPFKRYEIGKIFRDGPVKVGRSREFIQCDVDVVGVKSMIAEAELMSMAFEAFDKLDLDVYISYNNRKLLFGLLSAIGVNDNMINSVVLTLDKIAKIGWEGVKNELIEKAIDKQIITKLFEIINTREENILLFFINKFKNPLVEEGVKELMELNDYLNELGLLDRVKLNPFLARGLDIYTGTIYEIFLNDGSISSSIGGGGRYDNIIGGFLNNGREYPALGLSFGLDVIYTALTMKYSSKLAPMIEVLIIPLGTEKKCLKIANKLRKDSINVDIDMSNRKLNKVLNTANKRNIPYVIIIGEEEISRNRVSIKVMESGDIQECDINDIKNTLYSIKSS